MGRRAGAAPPLLGLHRIGASPVLAEAPLAAEVAMQGYAGSVAFAGDGTEIAISAPRGGRVHRFSDAGGFLRAVSRGDVCGLAPRGDGYLVSDGLGGLTALRNGQASPCAQHACAWDNHIVTL